MRKLLLFPALFLNCFTAFAGEAGDNANVTGVPSIGGTFPHFSPSPGSAGNPKLVNLRMIAKTYSVFQNGVFVPVDSTVYKYGMYRGSVPNSDDINNDDHVLFDLSIKYRYNTVAAAYDNEEQREQYFTNNKVDQLLYKKWHIASSSWKNDERYIYSYDNSGKMQTSTLQMWYGTLWTNNINSTLNYDQNNNVVNMVGNTYNIDFMYDMNNNLIKVEDRLWAPGTGWANNERKTYSYTGKDVVEYMLEKWDGSAWVKSQRWTYTNDANSNVTLSTEFRWTGNSWVEVLQHQYSYDGYNNKLEELESSWDSNTGKFVKSKREVRTYNAKLLPEAVNTYTWNGTAWVFASGDISIKYYYEQYDPTDINNLVSTTTMNVYPIPAKDNVTISVKLNETVDLTLTMIDMTGRVVFSNSQRAFGNFQNTIPVGNLPAGNYALSATDGNFIINKKIVVID